MRREALVLSWLCQRSSAGAAVAVETIRRDATRALLDRPYGIELDASSNLDIADTYKQRVRLVGS